MASMVLIATVHGYGAAWLAIRMLFRPHAAKTLFGLTIIPQGMIPRHRDRLAAAIGNAVGNELMSHDTITNALFGEKQFLRGKIETLVDGYADELIEREFSSLLEILPPQLRDYVVEGVSTLQFRLGGYISETLKNEETAQAVREFVDRQTDKILSRRVSETLDEETFEQILDFIETRVRGIVQEKAFETRVRTFINSRVDDLANTQTTLGEMFTPDFVQFFRERLTGQVQPIVHELAGIATSQGTRTQIGALIKTEVNDYYQQMPFYQKFFVSRDKLYKEVDDLVNTTLPQRIEQTLSGEAFAAEAEKFLNATVDGWMSRPIHEFVGQIAPEKLENLKNQIAGSLLTLARGAETQTSVSAYLTDTLQKIRPHSWRAIAERIHPEAAPRLKKAVTSSVLSVLQRSETADTINQILDTQIDRLLITPIGKLSSHLAPETIKRAADAVTERISAAAAERLPVVIKDFDIATLVREKVDAYPLEKLESLVLSIAGQHLRKIEVFGLVIGFILGLGQAFFLWVSTAK